MRLFKKKALGLPAQPPKVIDLKKKSEEVLCPNYECKETVTGLHCSAMLGFGSLNSILTISLRSPTSSAEKQ
jgi:hypothetical protein